MAKKIDDVLLNKLTEFLVCEVADKVFDGITYVMITKTPKEKKTYAKYVEIKKQARKCGFADDELFRIYDLPNGYIFDLDLTVAKTIIERLGEAIAKADGTTLGPEGLVGDKPAKRRKADMLALAKYVKKQYEAGYSEIEVALFSRNSTNSIVISGEGPKGEPLAVKYNAYAIRHWDIETINKSILIPAGIRIASISPSEILPSKTGVRFILSIERVEL